ncbi:MAG: hypothetical protein K9G60_11975 [Pseudolabrys sp.]|nr:hypothetical protein [Pseudolabrys sp.]
MNKYVKIACAVTLTGAFALAAASPSEARYRGHRGHNGAAAAIGFGVGALAGAAIANSAHRSYYEPDYYYDDPGYYAYEPAPVYRYRGRSSGRTIDGQSVPSCATDGGYGKVDYSAC